MSNDVFANGNAIACKAGDDKVIASMPDVCLSPPSPPAGPVPVPYPNTSFSKDMKNGSKTVKINGKEVMLKDQSFYKTSPLGDEAATRSFGGSVITHVITGKTYFNAWSMDVKFEDANVDRHMDLTTSNHASYPGSTSTNPALEKLALDRIAKGNCPCCNKAMHSQNPATVGTPDEAAPVAWYASTPHMNRDEWYEANIKRKYPSNPKQDKMLKKYKRVLQNAKTRKGCTCPKPVTTKLLPEPPCDVFFGEPVAPATRKQRTDHIKDSWDGYRNNSTYQRRHGIKSVPDTKAKLNSKGMRATKKRIRMERQVNHLTPKSAGGCPTGNNNLQPSRKLCASCQRRDARFEQFQ